MATAAQVLPSRELNEYSLFCNWDAYLSTRGYDAGKWLLFVDALERDGGQMTELDRAWVAVTDLVQKKELLCARCSTACNQDQRTHPEKGIVKCYTRAYEDKHGVKRAADAIRKSINYPQDMFYKTDEATRDGMYRRTGDRGISLYKHTVAGDFFERDQDSGEWKNVTFRKRVQNSKQSKAKKQKS